jgi:CheY-like chemotaxis protein/predicted regulator of Ras-like GTPase activity (Roadblock/LC7/MglB family)
MGETMAAKILVVDRNEAFSLMLQAMLEEDGGYQVEVTHRGSQALERLHKKDYDLTIVDMDLDPGDMSYQGLLQGIRHIRATMRVMLIPLMGEDLPEEARRFEIQGTLSKPFFADDLLPNIQEALSRQTKPSPPPAPPPAPTSATARLAAEPAADLSSILSELARETQADTILLLSASAGGTDIVAHVSTWANAQVETLAGLSVDTLQVARNIAHFVDQSDEPFEHHMFEGRSSRLYIMALTGDYFLVLITPAATPLGTIRHNLQRARRELAARALT